MDAIYTADTVARLGLIPNKFRTSCPFCLAEEPESLKHMIADCARWGVSRERFGIKELLDAAIKIVGNKPKVQRGQDIVKVLTGGEHRGSKLKDWNPRPSDEDDNPDSQFGGLDICSRVAGFLLDVSRKRAREMRQLGAS